MSERDESADYDFPHTVLPGSDIQAAARSDEAVLEDRMPAAQGAHAGDEWAKKPAAKRITATRVAVWLGVLLLACFAYFLPRYDWNQTARLDMTVAAVNHGTFVIDRYRGNTGDLDLYQGHYYSNKAPGLSLAGVPVYWAYKAFLSLKGTPPADTADDLAAQYVVILCTVAIPATLFLLLFFWFLGCFSPSLFNRALLTLALALGTNIFAYSQQLFSHVTEAAALFSGFVLIYILVHHDSISAPSLRRFTGQLEGIAILAGLALGTAILLEYPPAVIVMLIGGYALLRVPRNLLAYMAVGFTPPIMMVAAYNYAVYRNPFVLGYSSGTSALFQGEQAQGFGGFTWPPRPDAVYYLSISPYRGVFFLSPFLLLAIWGYRIWARRGGQEWLLFLRIPVVFFFVISMYWGWFGGVAVGPRYLTPMLPFLAFPVIFVLDKVAALPARDVFRVSVYGLILVSVLNSWIQTVSNSRILYAPEANRDPLFTYSLPALANNDIYLNRGMDLGLTGVASLLPLFILLGIWSLWIFRSALVVPVAFRREASWRVRDEPTGPESHEAPSS